MDDQWRSIPGRVTLTALTLLAAAAFTDLLAPPAVVASAPARPAEGSRLQLESPNERKCEADCSPR
jgi:hypothetical protein